MPLTKYQRERIVSLHLQSKGSASNILKLLAIERIYTTKQTVLNTLARWKETGSCEDRPKSGRVTKIPKVHYKYIDDKMVVNDELTASNLMDLLQRKFGETSIAYSVRTIARARLDLGWTFTTARYCQAIRDANKEKRLEWCKERLAEQEQFNDVIFTDESTFQLDRHRRKCFRKQGAPRKLKYKHKHPPKVHVWPGISRRGATSIVIFDGTMTATRYGDILTASLLPFIREKYPQSHRLYQDNDPKHTSRYIQTYFMDNRVRWWKSPAESPDLNPIEKVWGSMKTFLHDRHKPKNLGELKEGIKLYWKKMTPEVCSRYIDHLEKVLPIVVEVNREPSGH